MTDAVFLWQADGPGSEASGACHEQAAAEAAAAEYLLSGRATSAKIEAAVVGTGRMKAGARQSEYLRTGEAWEAAQAGRDGIRWVPAEAGAAPGGPR